MKKPEKCSCQEAFERLDDYLDRELTPEEIESVRLHLCECVQCAKAYQFEGRVLECVKKKIEHIQLPQDLLSRVKAALDACDQ